MNNLKIMEETYNKMTAKDEEIKVILTSTPLGEGWFQGKLKSVFEETEEDSKKEEKTPDKTTLVVPDAHVSPNQDLARFASLGNLITDKKPDNIILMGDFATLDSLSAWDLGKAGKMEGKRYSEDCKAAIQAIDLMLSPLR